MRTFFLRLAAPALGFVLAVSPVHAQTTIDTYPLWNGSNVIDTWGGNGSATYGQTFTADASHSVLTGMRFTLQGDNNPQNFRAYVFAWTGSNTMGSALFTSSSLLYDGSTNFQDIDVATGLLPLSVGQQYVAFFSVNGETGNTLAVWAYLGTSPQNGADGYAGGNFVFNNSPSFAGGWEDPTLYNGQATHDLAFRLSFAAVPEPGTYALIGLTAAGFLYYRRQKRQLALCEENRLAS
jgi:hypothetical protein